MATFLNFFRRTPTLLPQEQGNGPRFLLPPWMVGKPAWNKWDAAKATAEGYQASPWVYACVKKRVDAVAS